MDRDKMIKIIHVWSGRLQICLGCNEFFTGVICTCGNQFYRKATEDDYRRFLTQITGKSSCALMTDQELQLVFKEMIEIGCDNHKEDRKKAVNARKKLRYIIRVEATKLFDGYAQVRVDGFCEKVIGKPLPMLNDQDLRRVIGWLRRTEKSMKKSHC